MPDAGHLSMAGARVEAVAGIARLANSVLHAYKSAFTPSPVSTLADFEAAECDFDGYAPITIPTWAGPKLASQGYVIYAPTQTFSWAHVAADIGNQVGGTFLVLAGGDLYTYFQFDPTRPCQGPDQAIITTPTDVYPAG